MSNEELLEKFYTSFAQKNHKGMIECYHEKIKFKDPVFGILIKSKACEMWKMLLSKKDNSFSISYSDIETSNNTGQINWVAEYNYGPQNRKVINKVSSKFTFSEGKIIEHIDYFNLWRWTRQAIGVKGYLLGWSIFMKHRIRLKANIALNKYMTNN